MALERTFDIIMTWWGWRYFSFKLLYEWYHHKCNYSI